MILSNLKQYDRSNSFLFDDEINDTPFGSQSKGKNCRYDHILFNFRRVTNVFLCRSQILSVHRPSPARSIYTLFYVVRCEHFPLFRTEHLPRCIGQSYKILVNCHNCNFQYTQLRVQKIHVKCINLQGLQGLYGRPIYIALAENFSEDFLFTSPDAADCRETATSRRDAGLVVGGPPQTPRYN